MHKPVADAINETMMLGQTTTLPLFESSIPSILPKPVVKMVTIRSTAKAAAENQTSAGKKNNTSTLKPKKPVKTTVPKAKTGKRAHKRATKPGKKTTVGPSAKALRNYIRVISIAMENIRTAQEDILEEFYGWKINRTRYRRALQNCLDAMSRQLAGFEEDLHEVPR
jgi:hypothetical protein